MQTFLPFPGFAQSAAVLDRQRLGKQRVEVLQLLAAENARAAGGPARGWANHPAALAWRGHGHALARYGVAVCDEWTARKYRDTCAAKIIALAAALPYADAGDPSWLGDEAFHRSHRSNLLHKDPSWYVPRFPRTPCGLPYVWPSP